MTDFTFISSADNEKIKLYKRLSADKKLRRKEQLFTVEGARLTADAAAEAIELHCVFFTENALKKYSEALELLFSKYNKKTFSMISDELAASLSDTQMSQGIFAICRMPKSDNAAQYAEMKSGGIDAIITCNCCDVYNPKTVRSAMGSLMRVNIIDDDIGNAVLNLKNAGIAVYAAVIDSSAVSLTECDFSKGGAVMIGNEGNGLPSEHSALADVPLTIKMHGTINSLNAAMAAGIIMWELSKA